MRSIRSLLWIGTGRGLAASGMTEAPELDVTWVPDLAEALALPRVHFDGVLLEADKPEALRTPLARLAAAMPGTPLLVCLPHPDALADGEAGPSRSEAVDEEHGRPRSGPSEREGGDPGALALAMGASAALLVSPGRAGPGLVSAIGDCLDSLLERPVAAPSAQGHQGAGVGERDDGATPMRQDDERAGGRDAGGTSETADEEARALSPVAGIGRLVAASDAMQRVGELVELAASSPSTVLLTGETGVGKEVVARELHLRSGRAREPFLAINCAAFPENLLESELFGHVKGAFTGADRAKRGLFEEAGRGTLFLDEIAEMELPLQAKLLRVLQEREIRPVGGTRVVPVACRIVAATNRVLVHEVEAGRFREDLFYRLNVFPIRIPPLRERRRDILPLTRHFLALHGPREGRPDCPLSLSAAQLLESYAWPGNVRELENEILRMLMLTPNGRLITPKALSPKIVEILEPIGQGARPDETLQEALERVEAWMIRRALANNGGRKARTARRLGLTREGLYKKMKRLGIA